MAGIFMEFSNVHFTHESALKTLFSGLSATFPIGWTGIIGANGTGKTTLLRLASGELHPQTGHVSKSGLFACCPQRTDDPPSKLAELIESSDPFACRMRGQLALEPDYLDRWATLSQGERKRAQLAEALWRNPIVLALDEPTNHIDRQARALLATALRGFRGIGLLVSHDRDLLDELCVQCLLLDPPQASLYPGGYSSAIELMRVEHAGIRRHYEETAAKLERLEHEARRRTHEAAQADKKRSKRHLAKGDHDGRAKIDLARVTGKDGKAGRLKRQLDGRLDQLRTRLKSIPVRKDYALGISLSGEQCPRDWLFRLPAGALELGNRALIFPDLAVRRTDRISLTGPNGSGKSTLMRWIINKLELPAERLVLMEQEIPQEDGKVIVRRAHSLARSELGQVMCIIRRLGSDPDRLLATDDPSPGELRKLLLALGIARNPWLIMMDEPTNHLDLPSIERLEEALADCQCALLLVSHDLRFLRRLTDIHWSIAPETESEDSSRLRLDNK